MIPQSEIEKYRNVRYVLSVRVSDDGEKQNSDAAQIEWLTQWAAERQMVFVEQYVEPNLSGSLPGNRTDIKQILDRADTHGDFQIVLSQRIDRATRGGSDHLSWFRYELERRGIALLTPGDGLPEDVAFSGTLRAAKADAAKETAVSTSQRSAQGSGFALSARRISPHSKTPFGCYRLYCREDKTPLFVIVDKRNGVQEKRSWPDLMLIDTYGAIGGGKVGHYRKQKSELVYLVPGEPYERETVLLIYTWRYLDGLSARKIAQRLNELGRPAPFGGKWAAGQVASIAENEDYTARGIANRRTSALYHRRSRQGPVRVANAPKLMATASRIPATVLPKENWHEGDEPYLVGYLGDENLRAIAAARQTRLWERRLDPTWTRKNAKRHNLGPYALHPLLRDRDHQEPLVGSMSGVADKPVRVYRHKRGREAVKGNIYGRVLNAEALESAVLAVLRDVLLDWPDLEKRLRAHVEQQLLILGGDDERLAAKREQRDEVVDQLLLFIRTLNKKTRESLAPEIARLEVQRDALDGEIEMLTKQSAAGRLDSTVVVEGLRQRIETLAEEIMEMPRHALGAVLAQLTDHLTVDMATKQVEFAFHVPAWMLGSDAKTPLSALCMRIRSEFSAGPGTQPRDLTLFVPLADGACDWKVVPGKRVTCDCKRRRAA